MIELVNGGEECIDVIPAGERRDIAAGGDHEVGILAALLHNIQCSGADGFRRAAAELLGGADVAHADDVGGSLFHDFFHFDSVKGRLRPLARCIWNYYSIIRN